MPPRRRCRRDDSGEPCEKMASSRGFGSGCSGGCEKCGIVDEGKFEAVGDVAKWLSVGEGVVGDWLEYGGGESYCGGEG